MKKIIISGSKGFIGNNLKNLFIQNGYEVYIDKKAKHLRMFKHFDNKNNYYFYKFDLSKN